MSTYEDKQESIPLGGEHEYEPIGNKKGSFEYIVNPLKGFMGILRRGGKYANGYLKDRIWQRQGELDSVQAVSPHESGDALSSLLSDVNENHKEKESDDALVFAAQVFESSSQPHIAIASTEKHLAPFVISKDGRIEYVGQDSESECSVSLVAKQPEDALLVLIDEEKDADFESLIRLQDAMTRARDDREDFKSAVREALRSEDTGVVGLLDLSDSYSSAKQVSSGAEKSHERLKQERMDRVKGWIGVTAIAAAVGALAYFGYKENVKVGPEDMPPAPDEIYGPYDHEGKIRDDTVRPHD